MRFYRSEKKYGAAAYIWFIFALLFFSGVFRGAPAPLSLLELSTYQGKFGTIIEGAEPGFVGESRSSHHHGAAFKAYCSKYHAVYLKKY